MSQLSFASPTSASWLNLVERFFAEITRKRIRRGAFASVAALKGWQGWLELRRFELTHDTAERTLPPAGNRIEMADLRERVRKLEAIAAGIDL